MSHDHPYHHLLDAACVALSLAGLPTRVLGASARGWAVLGTAQGEVSVQTQVAELPGGPRLSISTGEAEWLRVTTAPGGQTVESLSVAVGHSLTGRVLDLPLDGYASGVAGDIQAAHGRLVPFVAGGWACLYRHVAEWLPAELVPAAAEALLSDAGFHVIEPDILTNGRTVVIGPLGHRKHLDLHRLLEYHVVPEEPSDPGTASLGSAGAAV